MVFPIVVEYKADTRRFGEQFLKALIVDDGNQASELMALCLTQRWPNVRVIATGSGIEAVRLTRALALDIVLLDLQLADLYGLQVLKEIRDFSAVPIIVVSANSEETSRWKSAAMGADDYLAKPFSNTELLASITAALWQPRIPIWNQDGAVTRPDLAIYTSSRRVIRGGSEVDLTQTEWNILFALLLNHGYVVPYARICQAGWGAEAVTRPIVRDCIQRLASKLGDDPQKPSLIKPYGDEGYSCALFS